MLSHWWPTLAIFNNAAVFLLFISKHRNKGTSVRRLRGESASARPETASIIRLFVGPFISGFLFYTSDCPAHACHCFRRSGEAQLIPDLTFVKSFLRVTDQTIQARPYVCREKQVELPGDCVNVLCQLLHRSPLDIIDRLLSVYAQQRSHPVCQTGE